MLIYIDISNQLGYPYFVHGRPEELAGCAGEPDSEILQPGYSSPSYYSPSPGEQPKTIAQVNQRISIPYSDDWKSAITDELKRLGLKDWLRLVSF